MRCVGQGSCFSAEVGQAALSRFVVMKATLVDSGAFRSMAEHELSSRVLTATDRATAMAPAARVRGAPDRRCADGASVGRARAASLGGS